MFSIILVKNSSLENSKIVTFHMDCTNILEIGTCEQSKLTSN